MKNTSQNAFQNSSAINPEYLNTVAEKTQNRDLGIYLLANFSMGLSAALMMLL